MEIAARKRNKVKRGMCWKNTTVGAGLVHLGRIQRHGDGEGLARLESEPAWGGQPSVSCAPLHWLYPGRTCAVVVADPESEPSPPITYMPQAPPMPICGGLGRLGRAVKVLLAGLYCDTWLVGASPVVRPPAIWSMPPEPE